MTEWFLKYSVARRDPAVLPYVNKTQQELLDAGILCSVYENILEFLPFHKTLQVKMYLL